MTGLAWTQRLQSLGPRERPDGSGIVLTGEAANCEVCHPRKVNFRHSSPEQPEHPWESEETVP